MKRSHSNLANGKAQPPARRLQEGRGKLPEQIIRPEISAQDAYTILIGHLCGINHNSLEEEFPGLRTATKTESYLTTLLQERSNDALVAFYTLPSVRTLFGRALHLVTRFKDCDLEKGELACRQEHLL